MWVLVQMISGIIHKIVIHLKSYVMYFPYRQSIAHRVIPKKQEKREISVKTHIHFKKCEERNQNNQNNRENGDLRRHRAHNDVTVMEQAKIEISFKTHNHFKHCVKRNQFDLILISNPVLKDGIYIYIYICSNWTEFRSPFYLYG